MDLLIWVLPLIAAKSAGRRARQIGIACIVREKRNNSSTTMICLLKFHLNSWKRWMTSISILLCVALTVRTMAGCHVFVS